jgi:hypothetical protein
MATANTILLIVGIIQILFGIGVLFYPGFSRWINSPGGPKLKAIITIVVGIILIIVSQIVSFSR